MALLQRNSLIWLTTLMWNQTVDLYGYRSLLANGLGAGIKDVDVGVIQHPLGTAPDDQCETLLELYRRWSQVSSHPEEDFIEIPYELLDPDIIVQIGPDISAIRGYDCFPFLFRASVMLRTVGD